MKREDKWIDMGAAVIVRILYFAGGFAVSFYLMFRIWVRYSVRYGDPYELNLLPLLVVSLAIGILTAVVGPHLYRQSMQRGRGSLKEIKVQSEQGNKKTPKKARRKQ